MLISKFWWHIYTSRNWFIINICSGNGPLASYVKLWVAHAPGMPGTFSPPPRVSDPDMHHGTCVTHVSWCMPGSLSSGFLWSRWRGERSRYSRRTRNPQFYVSGKRSMPSRYLNECRHFDKWTNLSKIWIKISKFSSLTNVFQNVACNIAAILSRHQCIKRASDEHKYIRDWHRAKIQGCIRFAL